MITNQIKLIKYLVIAGAGSRRECQRLLVDDRVTVNGQPVHQPSMSIDPQKDKITLDKRLLKVEAPDFYYVLLNKPVATICSHNDDKGRKTIYSLIKHKYLSEAGLFSAGRLDYNTSGLIILTNDGEFANLLTHPRYEVKKEYIVEIKRPLDADLIRRMLRGVRIDEEILKFEKIYVLKTGKKGAIVKIILNEGKNREIRRMMQFFNVTIRSIHRTKMGPFVLGDLLNGEYKLMKKSEIEAFRRSFQTGAGSGES